MAIVSHDYSLLTDDDLHWFNEGTHRKIYQKFGAHRAEFGGQQGVHFAVWAPNAASVSVMGQFNGWSKSEHPLQPLRGSGIWGGFIPGLNSGTHYKYHIVRNDRGYRVDKADPVAFHAETPPYTASIVWDLDYDWNDSQWMLGRGDQQRHSSPISIYEVHLGSWRRPDDPNRQFLTYRELAPALAEYVSGQGFTHVEFLPLMEHPFYGSWGYQTTGFFAPTSRFGTPQDLMFLIDTLHQHGVGVILDWVPSHFPNDEHGLGYFDGTHLFEHADPRQGFHPDWNSLIFNYGRNEVRSFLLSSAFHWLDTYHADGLRVDAVASMLYLDYSRKHGEWIPNRYGGNENLEAIDFLRQLNHDVYGEFPDVVTVAEESTAWAQVSRPTSTGGLGFGYKWDMGWMHDTLHYMSQDPVYRKYHHGGLTFRGVYAFTENYVMPLSHDEVVYGKGSLIGKMPGDDWQKFANLRLLYGYQFTLPGKKLMFMGGEFGQWREWNHDGNLQWELCDHPSHAGLQRWVRDLNTFYRGEPALHEWDCEPAGFEWGDVHDSQQSVLSWLRKSKSGDWVLVVCNFTPVVRDNYRVGVPQKGFWKEVLNSDAPLYGGSGQGNLGGKTTVPAGMHNRFYSLTLTVPPLGMVAFKYAPGEQPSSNGHSQGSDEGNGPI